MDDLLALAIEDPAAARRRAQAVLDAEGDPCLRSYAHQCLGIVLRHAGATAEAIAQLRQGVVAAVECGDPGREQDVRATLGGSLAFAGDFRAGLAELDRALHDARGAPAARIRMRKGGVLAVLGRYDDAVAVLREAMRALPPDDHLWVGRTRVWLGFVELRRGRIDVARTETAAAAAELAAAGAVVERIAALENLAEIAVVSGAVVDALRLYERARADYRAAGVPPRFDLVALSASASLAAGLPDEAVRLLREHDAARALPLVEQSELELLLAGARLAGGEAKEARAAAERATTMFRAQGRSWFERRARLMSARALHALGEELPASSAELARALDEERSEDAPVALTLAGHHATGPARLTHWERAASYRTHPNALVRAAAWHARSLAREEMGDRGGVLRAAAAGLDAIDEHRRLIGSSELRALATTHGRELTAIALRHAADDPRTLLRWSERTRATALAQPPATSDAATIPRSLAALRDNGRRLAEARQAGEPADALARERLRLERAVRAESHTLSASTAAQQRPPGVEEVVAAVGDGCLVELVDVDGVLHVLVVSHGTVRRRVAAPTDEVAALLAPTQMLLRRASRGRAADMRGLGEQLQRAILGDAARLLPDGPVVLAPTARLHGLAWSLLPVLGERPFAVVPSAGAWLRARATPRSRDRRTVLVSGPGLATGGAEVPLLAAGHPAATLLDGPAATLDAVLRALDGADLVHLAAHGSFRADSPLFSALDLADGPLTVHELERVRRAPYRVVLSACESGVVAPVGAEELLGLAAALFALGTAGLVSSVAEVNDVATADLMGELHAALASGSDPATALHAVRGHAGGDPVMAGTAAAFLALGV
ncbi:CHAT domain-containing protein [Nocardioides sp. LML1-1-1.1]|uniref:CHAT domain-containing protein n=1 Tax=Nocardioides sp. LML1-1-1.1 TaxID=3135248 RepID=UPI00341AF486